MVEGQKVIKGQTCCSREHSRFSVSSVNNDLYFDWVFRNAGFRLVICTKVD